MQASSGRLMAIRVVLWIGLVLAAFWGVAGLVFPSSLHDAIAPANEPFNSSHNAASLTIGSLALAWAFALAMAIRWPLQSPGLLLAITAAMLIIGIVGVYVTAFVSERATALMWGTDGLLIALGVALALVLFIPRGSEA
jgi:hypothetical protein